MSVDPLATQSTLRYQELLEINRLITSTLDHDAVLPVVVECAARLLDGEAAALLLLDRRRGDDSLRVVATHNIPPESTAGLRVPVAAGTMAEIRRLFPGSAENDFVGVPMVLREETVGVLAVYCRQGYRGRAEDEELLSALADQAAIAIENARLYKEATRADYLQTVLASIPDPVYVTHECGAVVLTNQAGLDLLGVSTIEALQRPLSDWAPPYEVQDPTGRTLEASETPIGRALRGENFAGMETRFRSLRGGPDVWTTASGAPLRNRLGQVLGCVVASRDITEQKKAERFREAYVHAIGHALRNPLTSISGMLQWLQRGFLNRGMSQDADVLDTVLTSTRRLASMVQDMVDSAQLEAGQVQLRRQPTDLGQLVTELAERVGTPEDRARIEVRTPEWVPPVLADQVQVERAITNLLTNALKYSSSENPVVVRLGKQDGFALVSIADRGVGILAEDIPFLFERYFRAQTGNKAEGLGLGLYITRLIVEAHEGRIWVESEVGIGTTFFFSLPLA